MNSSTIILGKDDGFYTKNSLHHVLAHYDEPWVLDEFEHLFMNSKCEVFQLVNFNSSVGIIYSQKDREYFISYLIDWYNDIKFSFRSEEESFTKMCELIQKS